MEASALGIVGMKNKAKKARMTICQEGHDVVGKIMVFLMQLYNYVTKFFFDN